MITGPPRSKEYLEDLHQQAARAEMYDASDEAHALAALRWFFPRWSVTVCDLIWEALPVEHLKEGEQLQATTPAGLAMKIIQQEYTVSDHM